MKRLSIITPAFRAAPWLERCVENVASQGVSDRIEHVIVDGGSQDGTVPLLERLAARHPHLVWRSAPDRGQGDAINKATALASGVFIGMLNADDEYLPGTLAFVLDLLPGLPEPTLLVGDCEVVDPDHGVLFVNRPRGRSAFALAIGLSHPSNPAAYFYHRSLHARAGGYDVEDHFSLDVDFLWRAMPLAHVRYVARTLGRFNMVPGSKTLADAQAGPDRIDALRRRYLRRLPLHQRLAVPILRTALLSERRLRDAFR